MANIVRTPFLPLQTLQEEVDRLFKQFLPFRTGDEERLPGLWSPLTDLTETETEYLVKMDLPGMVKENVKIEVKNHVLTVSGERADEKKEEKENFLTVERSYGSFYRSFALPEAVKEEAVKAQLTNGVLTIHIPKTEVVKPKQIHIS